MRKVIGIRVRQGGKLCKTDTAGGAFAAALSETQMQEGIRQLNGTVSLRRDLDTLLQIPVQAVNNGLGLVGGVYAESAQF